MLERVETKLIQWFRPRAIDLLRISIASIYLLFGGLKFLPNYSPAESLAGETIFMMTGGLIEGQLAIILLAVVEIVIGVGLLIKFKLRWMILIAVWHMLCTFFPLFFLPEYSYTNAPTSLSLVAQYILKNVVVLSALITIYCDSRLEDQASASLS